MLRKALYIATTILKNYFRHSDHLFKELFTNSDHPFHGIPAIAKTSFSNF